MVLSRLRSDLAEATIISLGQRPAPAGLHNRQLVLQRQADGAELIPMAGPALATAR